MFVDFVDAFDQDFSGLMINAQDFSFGVFVRTGNDFDDIVDLDFHLFSFAFGESKII